MSAPPRESHIDASSVSDQDDLSFEPDIWPALQGRLLGSHKQGGAPWRVVIPLALLLVLSAVTLVYLNRAVAQDSGTSHSSIYHMKTDGSGRSLLITTPGVDDGDPAVSSDGQFIAYTVGYSSTSQVEIANIDGSNGYKLPPALYFGKLTGAQHPSWMHDQPDVAVSARLGEQNVIVAAGTKPNMGIDYISGDAYGDHMTSAADGDNIEPAWSPNGSQVAFASNRVDGDYEIFLWNAGETRRRRLTYSPGPDMQPSWSPDRRRLLFVSERDGNKEIYVMNADGSDPRRLTNDPAADNSPVFSPDGKSIVFASNRSGDWDIYRMNTDGSAITNLTNSPQSDDGYHGLCFSPDGQQIYYSSVAVAPKP